MEWHIKTFSEMSAVELYRLLTLRCRVFVVEQNCPYQDVDGFDEKAFQLFAVEKGIPVFSLRILPPGLTYDTAAIGRVVTEPDFRGRGLAREGMQRALLYTCECLGYSAVKIGAQNYLRSFYESLGFKAISEVYLEDNIPHLDMLYLHS